MLSPICYYSVLNFDTIYSTGIIIKDNGTIEEPTEPIQKQDLINDFGLQARDLRTLDSHILDVRPTLIVASKSILYCSPILRAVISHDKILLIGSDPSNSNSLTSHEETLELVRSIQNALNYIGKSNGKIAPFEFRLAVLDFFFEPDVDLRTKKFYLPLM